METVLLGLGSNWGDRVQQLSRALLALSRVVSGMSVSSVYETEPLLPEDAPPEWNCRFYNLAASCETALSPRELLVRVKAIEQELGREARGVWGPREIDIDILAYGNAVMEEEDLVIPHKGLLQRDFVLLPLAEIAPHWRYPRPGRFYGCSVMELCRMQGFVASQDCFPIAVDLRMQTQERASP